jgi:hypothetical protein
MLKTSDFSRLATPMPTVAHTALVGVRKLTTNDSRNSGIGNRARSVVIRCATRRAANRNRRMHTVNAPLRITLYPVMRCGRGGSNAGWRVLRQAIHGECLRRARVRWAAQPGSHRCFSRTQSPGGAVYHGAHHCRLSAQTVPLQVINILGDSECISLY